MAIKNANSKSWVIKPSLDGKRYSSNPNGDYINLTAPSLSTPTFSGTVATIPFTGGAGFTYVTPQYSLDGVTGWTSFSTTSTSPLILNLPNNSTTYYFRVLANGNALYPSNVVNGVSGIAGSGGITATLVGSTLTVTGNIPTKSQAAPIFYRNWSSHNQGDGYLAAGFDFIDEDGSGGRANLIVDKTTNIGIATGHGAFRHTRSTTTPDAVSSLSFPSCGIRTPASEELFCSAYFKPINSSGATFTNAQMKGWRLGSLKSSSVTLNSNPQLIGKYAYYATAARFANSHYDNSNGSTASNENQEWGNTSQSNGGGSGYISGGDPSAVYQTFLDGNWHQWDFYGKFNTLGQSNGVSRSWIDGKMRGNQTNLNPRLASDEFIDFVIPNPGFTNGWDLFSCLISNLYIDNTLARVCFRNPTTGKTMPVAASTWTAGASGQIVANNCLPPTGYTQIEVFDANGNSQVTTL